MIRKTAVGAAVLITLLACNGCGGASGGGAGTSQAPLRLDGSSYTFDGWGVSLAWWAHVIGKGRGGQWQPSDRETVMRALFGNPDQVSSQLDGQAVYPLGLNILRYNIGASPANNGPELPPLPAGCLFPDFRAGGAIPSPQQGRDRPIDLNLDARQIDVLTYARTLIDQTNGPGEKTILEAFANSPPWWLTRDGCPAGVLHQDALNGTNAVNDYARYLVSVVAAFEQQGIHFSTLEPFNEPDSGSPKGWWGGCRGQNNACQEGANFTSDAQQQVVSALCAQIGRQPNLSTQVSVDDGNSPDDTLADVPTLLGNGCVAQVNTHGYSGIEPYIGSARLPLRQAASGKRLWMSEFGDGPCARSESSEPQTCSGMKLAKQIADDLQSLRPSAWVYWQGLEGKGGWGLVEDRAFPNPPGPGDLHLTTRYWVLAQYSRFIGGGSKIYPLKGSDITDPSSGATRVVVAKNLQGQVIVVATNPSASDQPLDISLASLGVSGAAMRHRLSFESDQAQPSDPSKIDLQGDVLHDPLPPQTVTTYVLAAPATGVSTPATGGAAAAPPACSTDTLRGALASTKFGPNVGSINGDGQPVCVGGYALQIFIPYPGGQPGPFYFKTDPSGHWVLIEGGDTGGNPVACSTIPAAVMAELGPVCLPPGPQTNCSIAGGAEGGTGTLPFITRGLSCAEGRPIVEGARPPQVFEGFNCQYLSPGLPQPGSRIGCTRGTEVVSWNQIG